MMQSTKVEDKHSIVCHECMNAIELNDPSYDVGFVLECPYCGTTLEVVEVEDDGTVKMESVEYDK